MPHNATGIPSDILRLNYTAVADKQKSLRILHIDHVLRNLVCMNMHPALASLLSKL
jgi:hypothetical protein